VRSSTRKWKTAVEQFDLTLYVYCMSNVDHPTHYNKGKIEAIEIIEDWDLNFNLGNVIKYVLRAPYKGETVQDLEKAHWYLTRELKRRKGDSK
jgi:hypothetical protein